MDQKGFELFQTAIQWVLDEKRASQRHVKHTGLWHRQAWWGAGRVTEQVVKAVTSTAPFLSTNHQFSVICVSSCCVAGNIVTVHGDKMVVAGESLGNSAITDYCVDDDDRLHLIGTRAAALTGITEGEAAELFSPNNSRERVIELATQIAKDHGYELELV